MNRLVPSAVRSFVEAHVGAFEIVRDASTEYRTAAVYEIRERASGRALYLKHHHQRQRFEQECAFYERFIDPIADRAPRLVARSDASIGCIVTTALSGRIADPLRDDSARDLAIAREAGRLLRRIHDQPFVDHDPMPLRDAVLRRLTNAIDECTDIVDSSILERVRQRVNTSMTDLHEKRVPCHRDFIPRNWIVNDSTNDDDTAPVVQVIDFDEARPDTRLWDFVRLNLDWYVDSPRLWRALIDGYDPDHRDQIHYRLDHLRLVNSLGMIRWGRDVGDPAFEMLGRQSLDRVLATH